MHFTFADLPSTFVDTADRPGSPPGYPGMTNPLSTGNTAARTTTSRATERTRTTDTRPSMTPAQIAEVRQLQRENNRLLIVAAVLVLAALITMGVLVT